MPLFSTCLGPVLLISFAILLSTSFLLLTRLTIILLRPRAPSLKANRSVRSPYSHPTHALVVLGSGGHTTEMLDMLRRVPRLRDKFTHRTYVLSSGDGFSAKKAGEFEKNVFGATPSLVEGGNQEHDGYDILTVRRARRVHQSLLSTPWSAFMCLWDCIKVLRGKHPDQVSPQHLTGSWARPVYPDLILTNGPGTGVCVIFASLALLFVGLREPSLSTPNKNCNAKQPLRRQDLASMRSVFIESWARVNTLSLSGLILLPLVDRFLVQWPGQRGLGGGKAEFVGTLVA